MPLLFASIYIAFLLLVTAHNSMADDSAVHERAIHTPQICDGLIEDETGRRVWSSTSYQPCANNHAIFSLLPWKAGRFADPSDIGVTGSCCPLPAADILSTNTHQTESSCPENYVVTGVIGQDPSKHIPGSLVCTEINTNRYQLGPVSPGLLVGMTSNFYRTPRMLTQVDLSPAFRYSVGRAGLTDWFQAACVGESLGSILVGKKGKRCHHFDFRQLQFRGLAGDPPSGTPVVVFADCTVVTGVLEGEPKCIP